jgi:hypothetical protein
MLASALAALPAYGQRAADHTHTVQHTSTMALQQESANPVGSLVSLPLQFNFNQGTGPDSSRTTTVVNFEPVVPMGLSEDWLFIPRLILPIKFQPVGASGPHVGGLSDADLSLYVSPAKPGKLTWGAGPSFLLPTATEPVLGTGKWGVGPSAVLVVMPGDFVIGSVWTQIWSFAGDSQRESVSSLSWQYFIVYNMAKGWSLLTAPTMTADWNADSGNKWTVPVGGGFERLGHIGHQIVKLSVEAYWNAARPDGAAAWTFQFTTFLIWR